MRAAALTIVALLMTLSLTAEPTADQRALVKKYDGKEVSASGLKKLKTQDNGWTQYQWTEGRFLWIKTGEGWWAAVEPDGTEIYRYSATEYAYHFPDGRVMKSNPVTGAQTWTPMAGDPAPDFELTSLDGKTKVKLSSLRGKVVFLDFWASWCGPCQEALPGTEALYQKFKGQGLAVLGINVEGDNPKALANAAQLKLSFPSLAAQAGANGKFNWDAVQVADYQVTGIPHGVLIDKKGVIRARDTIVDDEALIKVLLAE